MFARRVLVSTTAFVACAALLSACGGGASSNGLQKKSPEQIIDAALGAMSAASSTNIKGEVKSGSERLTVDLTMFKNGDSDGTFGLTSAPGHLVIVGKTVYFKGAAAFWQGLSSTSGATMPAIDADKLAGRWVTLPSSSDSGFATFTLAYFVKAVRASDKKLSKVGTHTIDGYKTVGVNGSAEGTVWVSTTGTPYPVETTDSVSKTSSEVLVFSGWDAGTAPTVPKGSASYETLLG